MSLQASSTTPRSAAPSPTRGRDRWRTIRTITCELRALTGPAMPAAFGRPLAGPEVVVEVPRFQGHLLHAPVLPVARTQAPTPPPAAAPTVARRSRGALVAPLLLFGITGFVLGCIVALASG